MRIRRGAVILVIAALGIGLLGGVWLHRRYSREPAPRWNDAEFVRLAPAEVTSGAVADRELWVLPLNPSCSHCTSRLAEFRARAGGHDGNRLVVLIVDAPRRPDTSTIERLGEGVEVWWDARSIWRGRWGYRVYGEPLCFDAAGGFLRIMRNGKTLRPVARAGTR